MNKKHLLKTFTKIGIIICFVILNIVLIPYNIYAQDSTKPEGNGSKSNDLQVDGFNIMPELKDDEIEIVNQKVNEVGQSGGEVWKNYNEIASGWKDDPAKGIASGIIDRDTIMNYIVFIVKYLNQLGLLVGFGFIMYAGYKYMLSVFDGAKSYKSSIKNAIIGVVIIIFSYAIMKTLTSIIGIS